VLPSVLRTNLESNPTALSPCELTGLDFGALIGLEKAADEIVTVTTTATTTRKGRSAEVGMLTFWVWKELIVPIR